MPSTPTAALSRSERLDRLTFNRKHGQLLVGSGIGWALDAMDVGLMSFIMAALVKQGLATTEQTAFMASVGFLGMAIGATLGGAISDRVGRRNVFALTLVLYGVATGFSALATTLLALTVLRFFIGLGLGAELPVASTLVSEFSPRHIRGRMVVWLEAFWAVGWILAALIGTFIVARSEDGWRWGLAVGLVPAAYALVVRYGLPESVRFLESKGRIEEAEQAVREFEAASGMLTAPEEVARADLEHAQRSEALPTEDGVSIWSGSLRHRTIGLWTVWFCINLSYYGAFIWIPSILLDQGFDMVKSFSFTLIITLAQVPGYAVAAWLIEAWGRRATLAAFLAGSAVGAWMFGYAGTGALGIASPETMIIISGCILSFFNLGAWGALYAIGPELYPSNVRGTGTGAAAGFGRIASIMAPLIVPPLIGWGGPLAAFTLFGAAFALAAGAAFLLPEQKGTALAD